MSKLMIILGIVVAAAGAVIGALIYVSPGLMLVWGLTPEVAAILLVSGFSLVGLGGVISAVERNTAATRALRDGLAGREGAGMTRATSPAVVSDFTTSTIAPPSYPVPAPPGEPPLAPGSKFGALLKESSAEVNRAVAETQETTSALDKAKEELEEALSPHHAEPPTTVEPAPAPVTETVAAAEVGEITEPVDEADDTQLFVVEERLIRGRPARVLSDGTVEAETDDGWMRFENLEHLEEYLDAMSPGQA